MCAAEAMEGRGRVRMDEQLTSRSRCVVMACVPPPSFLFLFSPLGSAAVRSWRCSAASDLVYVSDLHSANFGFLRH